MIGGEINASYKLILKIPRVQVFLIKAQWFSQGKEKASQLRHVDESCCLGVKLSPDLSESLIHISVE